MVGQWTTSRCFQRRFEFKRGRGGRDAAAWWKTVVGGEGEVDFFFLITTSWSRNHCKETAEDGGGDRSNV